ncbi:Serine/threonine-protein kinase toxin HipA [bioreactor metagenome]|uniref:Serine/threonine-protein kinase toxin HipA n=1 Tax=bioreactor metagenome TaxID=1076179 RepID=A0A644XVG1_9ZZZZ
MAARPKSLAIWMNGSLVGTWAIGPDRQDTLIYDNQWYATPNRLPLSLSLPMSIPGAELKGTAVASYFDNLLPDSVEIRRRIAGRYGLQSTSAFELLSAIGRDCVGAIQLLDPGALPTGWDRIEASPMSNEKVRDHLRSVTVSPSLAVKEDLRISIAGAQEKSGLLELHNAWWMPHHATPTNRILKLALGSIGGGLIPLHNSIENEWLCAQILKGYDIPVAECEIKDFAGTSALSVHRFDRQLVEHANGSTLYRLPQEDFCQVLAMPPHLKYESDGGPGFLAIAHVLRSSANAQADITTLFQAQVLFWMLLGVDGHAKNFSIMLRANGRYQLAPLYDVISMWPYAGHGAGKASLHKLKMAMAVVGESGKHYVWSKIQRRHFEHMGFLAGIADPAGVIDALIARTPAVIRAVRSALPADFPSAISHAIFSGVVDAALKLGRAASN